MDLSKPLAYRMRPKTLEEYVGQEHILGKDKILYRTIKADRLSSIILFGPPGCGKTSLARVISETTKYKFYKINAVTSGVSDIKRVIEETKNMILNPQGKSILFIDEIHTIVGAGSAEGAIDAANILKPLLARGEIQLIGATTLNEYRKYIEKDSALERRFSPVTVNEPTHEETVEILKGIRDKYEAHHNIKITDEAINAAVELSSRYINDRFLPDKAIDLIDEASSKIRLSSLEEPDSLKEMEDKIEKMNQEKEAAVKVQKFEKAAKIRDEVNKLKEELEEERNKWKSKKTKAIPKLTEEDIAKTIASWTGIPAAKITQDENKKLKNLDKELHKRVIGQNEAVEAVAKAIRRSRVVGKVIKVIPNFRMWKEIILTPKVLIPASVALLLLWVFFSYDKVKVEVVVKEEPTKTKKKHTKQEEIEEKTEEIEQNDEENNEENIEKPEKKSTKKKTTTETKKSTTKGTKTKEENKTKKTNSTRKTTATKTSKKKAEEK